MERPEASRKQRIIYATYLSDPTEHKDHFISEFRNTRDPYFDAARILTYQLLHASETQTRLAIPFVVFIHQNFDIYIKKEDRLQTDGAEVTEWSDFRVDWVRPTESRWADVLTKLRLWEMVQYDRILLLSGDSVLARCLDRILSTYVASNHSLYPSRVLEDFWDWDTLNAGFMILQPSLKMFHYFEELLAVEDSFDTSMAVLNVTLSRGDPDPTPWITVNFSWNI
ncbi:hypothetical protein N7516_009699 [Penicillium verrucosum]|uniref:uncharacterized protein n=1 Tax=Penicillium verrucosum TaxID=60171 RepID=UPI0025452551|nr:uncharacterized protein N7516_009699 [Penicillium verrucosum]KAJ5921996.1 hypothetical protein N7516_009699 [Penicillium verrucosum]